MLNKLILTFLMLLTSSAIFAQDPYYPNKHNQKNTHHRDSAGGDSMEKKGFSPKKLVYGGWGWAQFGNQTYVELSPLVGYRFTKSFTAGIGPRYIYQSQKNIPGYINYSLNTYGGRVYGEYKVTNFLVAHAEFEELQSSYLVQDYTGNYYVQKGNFPGLFLGGGYRQPLGGSRSAFVVYVLYNVLYDNNAGPYTSPWVFNVGFLF